jgi:hypothetical protein
MGGVRCRVTHASPAPGAARWIEEKHCGRAGAEPGQ